MSATPGPWKQYAKLSASENHRGFRVYSDRDAFGIADVSPVDEDGKTGHANALLIAAAPDLLAIAEQVAEHFRGTDAPLGVAARAAISKATGADK